MFTKSNYLVKEQVSFMKLVDRYDIFDPENGQMVAYAKENISGAMKFLRLLVNKGLLPTTIDICDAANNQVALKMEKRFSWWKSRVEIFDGQGKMLGYFLSRVFSLGGRFDVFDPNNSKIAEVKGEWTGWNFRFLDTKGAELGKVTKKWAGLGQELFTSADNYVISLNPQVQAGSQIMELLIMAGIAIDVVYKERK